MAAKIFVLGPANGNLKGAFGKLATLHAKNNFSFAIATGDLFSAEDDDDSAVTELLAGHITVPVTTYFTVGTRRLPQPIIDRILKDEEICPNLHFLGKRSIHKTSEGVRIVTLGGVLDATLVAGQSKEQHLPFHSQDDAKALRGANTADILLTATWPAKVWKGSNVALPDPTAIPGSETIADLVVALKPRYHLTASPGDFFYEREPFFHPPKDGGEGEVNVTRFISLATYGNAAKAKAMYAFSLSRESVTAPPTGSTISPFPSAQPARKRPALEAEPYSRFSNGHHEGGGHRHKKHRRNASPPPGPDRCFFCLSNPNFQAHMVTSVGDDAFLATTKGPLPASDTFKEQGLDFPGHLVIVPLIHAPTITTAAMGDDLDKTVGEMSRFRDALQTMVSTRSKHKLGTVTWEISRARNIHHHWQFMPVPAAMVHKGLVEAAFRVEAENMKLPKLEVKDFASGDAVEGDYFRVWLSAQGNDGGEAAVSKSLLMRFDETVRFDLQYGRKVMAKLLGLEKRMDWRDWVQSPEEETADAEAFKAAFKEYDFTLA